MDEGTIWFAIRATELCLVVRVDRARKWHCPRQPRQDIECAFDYVLWAEADAVLGVPVTARYGSYFPICFDYLDTMGGTNLSCQVHPRVDYIRDHFGKSFTQDETYYIVSSGPESRVYLGLRDDANVTLFCADVQAARDRGIPFAAPSIT